MAHIPLDRAMEMPDEDTEKTSSNTTGFPPTESFSTFPSEDEVEPKVPNDLSSDGEVEGPMASSVASITAQANNATEDPTTNTANEPILVLPNHAATPLSPGDNAYLRLLRQERPQVLTRTESIPHGKPPVFWHDHEFEHPAVLRHYPANSPEPVYDGVRYRADAVFNYDAYLRGELPELESFIKPTVLASIARFDLNFSHEAAL